MQSIWLTWLFKWWNACSNKESITRSLYCMTYFIVPKLWRTLSEKKNRGQVCIIEIDTHSRFLWRNNMRAWCCNLAHLYTESSFLLNSLIYQPSALRQHSAKITSKGGTKWRILPNLLSFILFLRKTVFFFPLAQAYIHNAGVHFTIPGRQRQGSFNE